MTYWDVPERDGGAPTEDGRRELLRRFAAASKPRGLPCGWRPKAMPRRAMWWDVVAWFVIALVVFVVAAEIYVQW